MSQIVLLLSNKANAELLSQWLGKQYEVTIGDRSLAVLQKPFDLAFVDDVFLRFCGPKIARLRQEKEPVFLPFVLLTVRQDLKQVFGQLADLFDEIIQTPVEKSELATRIKCLLRSRHYSLELQKAKSNAESALAQEKELNQLKSTFVSIVSHEFRNPLNSISGWAQLLKQYDAQLTPEKKQDLFRNIDRSISQMLLLLDDVLILGRAGVGKLNYKPSLFDLRIFCLQISQEIRMSIGDRAAIELDYTGENQVNLDPQLLQHILSNLLSNALKYSPENTPVQFAVESQTSQVIFTLRDRGIGIPEDEQKHLFDSFYRASNVGQIQGTGLGLAIVKQCVDFHGGQINFSSQPQKGTTVTVTLPQTRSSASSPQG
ncbi:MAG: HAMP domain-containing sensor histidine kinase [Jaaginema sp. PMC 1079.18]|nr:HAMP domain-containing sensor histidine kinase [Jaaginema sp. PMC 1080.18]MEC4852990.1 HAMP domain-containing sensor histidine kinase [Jaaginema sp. PMC 1079.18]MEC4868811.1 HAMP domain-containing sensor histidine kinase [Jaaginema sp. PMC 1078.18]